MVLGTWFLSLFAIVFALTTAMTNYRRRLQVARRQARSLGFALSNRFEKGFKPDLCE